MKKLYRTKYLQAKSLKLVLSRLLFVKGNRASRYGFLAIIISTLSYFLEVLFAISLQRFLGSANLIEQVTDTRFFGALRDIQYEAIFLILAGVLRSLLQASGTVVTGQTLIEFEKFIKKVLLHGVNEPQKRDLGSDAAIFGNVVAGGSNFIANLFVYFGKMVITILLLFTLGIYSLTLTLQVLIVVALSVPLQRYLVQKTLEYSYTVRQVILKSTSEYLRIIKNFEFLAVHRLMKQRIQTNLALNSQLASSRFKQYLFSSLRALLPQTLGVMTLVFLIVGDRIQSLDNKSEIVPFLYLLLRSFQNIADLTRMNSIITQDWPNISLLNSAIGPTVLKFKFQDTDRSPATLIESKSDLARHFNTPGVGMKMTSISYKLVSENRVLNVPEVIVLPGEFVVVSGESGIGKTTFLKLVSGLLAPDNGEINFLFPSPSRTNNAILVNGAPYNVAKREIVNLSYLPAESPLVTGTLFENLQFGRVDSVSKAEAVSVLKKVGLVKGFESENLLYRNIEELGSGLSSGQRQRLGFARALLQNPDLLILDEALSQIDDESRNDLLNVLDSLRGKLTVFSVSHNFDLSTKADKVIVFESIQNETFVECRVNNG